MGGKKRCLDIIYKHRQALEAEMGAAACRMSQRSEEQVKKRRFALEHTDNAGVPGNIPGPGFPVITLLTIWANC